MAGPPGAPAGQGRRTAHTSMVTCYRWRNGGPERQKSFVLATEDQKMGLSRAGAQTLVCPGPGPVLSQARSWQRKPPSSREPSRARRIGGVRSCASPSAPAYQAWP